MPALEDLLKPGFLDQPLFRRAVTHRSAGSGHNERLEFLGDAVLQLVITETLYERFPEADEGALSKLRAHLVRRETLSAIARRWRLGDNLVLGPGEVKSGGCARESILADAFEAVVGALYLCEGLRAARGFIAAVFGERLSSPAPAGRLQDAKSQLQEYAQSRGAQLPVYQVIAQDTRGGDRFFRVACTLPGLGVEARGEGASKRKAEQNAAESALRRIADDRHGEADGRCGDADDRAGD
ncbi:MAG: ribonuclease III [Gammaproteobacteria bacterium]|nr:ribonuclease III [Gammaproteobacteria bacterium]